MKFLKDVNSVQFVTSQEHYYTRKLQSCMNPKQTVRPSVSNTELAVYLELMQNRRRLDLRIQVFCW